MNDFPATLDLHGLAMRPLQPSDLEMICAQREAMFLEAGGDPARLRTMSEHFRPWLRPRLADGRYHGFALLDAGLAVAAIGLMEIEWPPHPAHPREDRRGYVLNVYVEPSHRRRGLASSLMRLAEAEFIRRGVGFAVLHATEVGRPVYAGLGWTATTEMAKVL
ncbi:MULTISPECIES: GNAT family N-acetyltransferase [unclassified Pseudomonas]|uniref:GNAT family N-acetyltransferase n=1 Tax=unclassified Pseudomonas TaxID=196821 RepID=UPI002446EA17|nr:MULTISPECIES: GNAT family N-acetyltransferase [unclassified Pseudomonas]MDH0303359.1 GNAT family N-acetyltransferase [Pseudomonas sp. GD04091]MDH1984574.1 GNAT family N-acetyltransferase [Pseudomonas sp. GD03689]